MVHRAEAWDSEYRLGLLSNLKVFVNATLKDFDLGIRNCKLHVLEIGMEFCCLVVSLHDFLQVINVAFKALLHGGIVLSHSDPLLTDFLLFHSVFVEKFCMLLFAFFIKPGQILNFMVKSLNPHFLCLNFDLLLPIYLISSHHRLVVFASLEIATIEFKWLILVEVSWVSIEYIIDVFQFHS